MSGLSESCGQSEIVASSSVRLPALVTPRMEGAEHAGNSAAFAQFAEQRAGCVGVGLAGIGGIGPDRVVNDLRCFFQIHVQSGFEYIDTLLQAVVTRLANRGWLGVLSAVIFQTANSNRARDFLRGCGNFRFELFQECLSLPLDDSAVGRGFSSLHLGNGGNSAG